MKTFAETKRTEVDKVLTSMICDLCGVKAKGYYWPGQGYNPPDAHGACYTKSYATCAIGSTETKIGFDICPKCFMEKLVPWMKEQGAEPQTETE